MRPLSHTPSPAESAPLRLRVVAACWAVFCVVLVLRLVQVQAWRHEHYVRQSDGQAQRRGTLKAERGRILDRRGNVLAVDLRSVSIFAEPHKVAEPEAVASHLASVTGQPAHRLLSQLQSGKSFVYLARQLDRVAAVRAMSKDFTGVHTQFEVRRLYPQGPLAAQVLGFTNVDNRGNNGLEYALDELVSGVDGEEKWQVDAEKVRVAGSTRQVRPPRDGCTVVLTLDMVYQDILEQELAAAMDSSRADAAMGIIMDPRSAEILAMANVPLFDPNRPGEGSSEYHRNRTVTDPYEPGSTFKIISLSGVLAHGRASPEEPMFCGQGRLRLPNGHTIRDHHPYGTLSFREVIEKSSNIGTIRFVQRLSRRELYEHLRCFGLGTRTGTELPGEASGMLAQVQNWSDRTLETIAIGQEISLTALQLAVAVSAVANGGRLLTPQIVKGVLHPDGSYEPRTAAPVRQVISSEVAARMRDILVGVVEKGTGKLARIEGVAIAGKTGTAQKAAKSGGYERGSYMVSFIGFLPADDPKLLCLVVVDNPRLNAWGGTIAAPAFRRVVERILHLPEGSRLRSPAPGREEEREQLLASVPDLRGMTRQTARYQASLRGLSVTFAGEGDLVVAQEPAPGVCSRDELGQIVCTLGEVQPADFDFQQVPPGLARQVQLLRALVPSEEPERVAEI